MLSLHIPSFTVLGSRRKGKRFCTQYFQASLNTQLYCVEGLHQPRQPMALPMFGDDINETFTDRPDVFA